MPDYAVGWHHRLLCDRLDAWVRGDVRRLIVNMPPRHGKSELASRRLPAYLLGRDPDCKLIACSNTAGLASDMNRDVQRVIEADEYARLFPGTRLSGRNVRTVAGPLPLRNSEVFEVVGRRGAYRSAGVGTSIVGKGFGRGIIDDPHAGREAADSPTQREAVWKWYTGDFYTRRAPHAGILLIMTRWHPEDLAGRLLRAAADDPKADQWEVLTLPAVAEQARSPGDNRQPGEALWPEWFPLAELEKTKAANPWDWWSQYQQQPRNPGSVEWPESHFDWPGFWFRDWPPDLNVLPLRVMSLDPSKGRESKAHDYQALVLYARGRDGTEYVECDMGKRPMTASLAPDGRTELGEGMVETAVDRAVGFRPEGLALETNGFQELLKIPLEQVFVRRGYRAPVYGLDNTVAKAVRIRRLGDPLSRRVMRFRSTPGTRLLVEQLKQFPGADHDDGPDALEMARRLAMELWNGRA